MRLLIAFLMVSTIMARAEVRRALIVGIDNYMVPDGYRLSELTQKRLKAMHGSGRRSKLDRLEGAFNDARGMKLKQSAFVTPRRVYVFVVDRCGHATLLSGTSNLQHEFPRPERRF